MTVLPNPYTRVCGKNVHETKRHAAPTVQVEKQVGKTPKYVNRPMQVAPSTKKTTYINHPVQSRPNSHTVYVKAAAHRSTEARVLCECSFS